MYIGNGTRAGNKMLNAFPFSSQGNLTNLDFLDVVRENFVFTDLMVKRDIKSVDMGAGELAGRDLALEEQVKL